jgi:hypothetical protein
VFFAAQELSTELGFQDATVLAKWLSTGSYVVEATVEIINVRDVKTQATCTLGNSRATALLDKKPGVDSNEAQEKLSLVSAVNHDGGETGAPIILECYSRGLTLAASATLLATKVDSVS